MMYLIAIIIFQIFYDPVVPKTKYPKIIVKSFVFILVKVSFRLKISNKTRVTFE